MNKLFIKSLLICFVFAVSFSFASCGKTDTDTPSASDTQIENEDTKVENEETDAKEGNTDNETETKAEHIWNDPVPVVPEKPSAPIITWTPSKNIQLVTKGEIDILSPELREFVSSMALIKEIDYNDESAVDISAKSAEVVNLEWKLDGISGEVTAKLSTNADLSDPIEVQASGNTASVNNLMTGTRYFWWVEVKTNDGIVRSDVYTVDIKDGPRILNLRGIINARDIGGWLTEDGRRIKEGLVFRCGNPDNAKQEGIDFVLNSLRLRTQLDLRTETEGVTAEYRKNKTGTFGETVNYINMTPAPAYVSVLTSQIFADEVRLFADPDNYPILFHCAGGADRTGSLALVLEALCGAGENLLVTDYELTNGRARNYASFPALVEKILSRPGETMREKAAFAMRELGLTKMEVSNIYNLLMTNSGIFKASSLKKGTSVDDGKEFKIDLRDSGGIYSVRVDNEEVEWNLNGDTLTVKAKRGNGVIVFNDGDRLEFN